MCGGWETVARTHLEERLCREGVCQREECLSLRVDFFPEVERDVVGLLVSAHGPDLLGFEDNEHLHMMCVVGLLTPMNHSLQETIVSSACLQRRQNFEAERLLCDGARGIDAVLLSKVHLHSRISCETPSKSRCN